MIIRTKYSEYPCHRAQQHGEDIYLFDEEGTCFTVLMHPALREVEGGQITLVEAPAPGPEERIAQLEEALDLLLSGVSG